MSRADRVRLGNRRQNAAAAAGLSEVGLPARVIIGSDARGIVVRECGDAAEVIAPDGVVSRVDDAVEVVVAGDGFGRTEDVDFAWRAEVELEIAGVSRPGPNRS